MQVQDVQGSSVYCIKFSQKSLFANHIQTITQYNFYLSSWSWDCNQGPYTPRIWHWLYLREYFDPQVSSTFPSFLQNPLRTDGVILVAKLCSCCFAQSVLCNEFMGTYYVERCNWLIDLRSKPCTTVAWLKIHPAVMHNSSVRIPFRLILMKCIEEIEYQSLPVGGVLVHHLTLSFWHDCMMNQGPASLNDSHALRTGNARHACG